MRAELFHADRRTDEQMRKLTVSFRNFVKGPKTHVENIFLYKFYMHEAIKC
jgi:hypothetical protein